MSAPIRMILASLAIASASALAACTTEGGGPAPEAASSVQPTLATACVDAASQKYFMAASRARAISAERKGKDYEVVMKVDTRDALCTVTAKGSVLSVVDTSPMSADQAAADKKAEAGVKKKSAD
jgi:hypothetical protein